MSKRIAAFFDIDGTLLAGPSLEWRFVSWLFANELVSSWHIGSWAATAVAGLLCGDLRAFNTNKSYLTGLPESLVQNWESSLSATALAGFPEAARRICWHAEEGHRVFLVSGTLAPLARVFAGRMGGEVGVCATRLEVVDGLYSGSIEGNHMSGPEKARFVRKIAQRLDLSLADSFAYGNHADDLAMLDSVGHPVAINPNARLKRLAARRRWNVEEWSDKRKTESVPQSAQPRLEAR
jgi:HAD superfamily hydrolase (TIGR01490 family)